MERSRVAKMERSRVAKMERSRVVKMERSRVGKMERSRVAKNGEEECVFSSRGLTSWSTKEGILRKSSNRNSKNSQRLWTRGEEWRCRGSKSKSKFSLT